MMPRQQSFLKEQAPKDFQQQKSQVITDKNNKISPAKSILIRSRTMLNAKVVGVKPDFVEIARVDPTKQIAEYRRSVESGGGNSDFERMNTFESPRPFGKLGYQPRLRTQISVEKSSVRATTLIEEDKSPLRNSALNIKDQNNRTTSGIFERQMRQSFDSLLNQDQGDSVLS